MSTRIRIIGIVAVVLLLGGPAPDPPGYDLRGVVVGSEGMVGIVTRICVRLTPEPPAIRTMLLDFPTVSDAAAVVEQVEIGNLT